MPKLQIWEHTLLSLPDYFSWSPLTLRACLASRNEPKIKGSPQSPSNIRHTTIVSKNNLKKVHELHTERQTAHCMSACHCCSTSKGIFTKWIFETFHCNVSKIYYSVQNVSQLNTQGTYTRNRGAFAKPLLPWESNKDYVLWVRARSLSCPASNAHAQYYTVTVASLTVPYFFHIIS